MENTLFEKLKSGLEDVIAFERGDTSRCRVVRCTDPVPEYTAQDVVRIRDALGMDRVGFALLMGVSSRTVQAWETGRGGLKGPVRRLLYLLECDPAQAEKLKIRREVIFPGPQAEQHQDGGGTPDENL